MKASDVWEDGESLLDTPVVASRAILRTSFIISHKFTDWMEGRQDAGIRLRWSLVVCFFSGTKPSCESSMTQLKKKSRSKWRTFMDSKLIFYYNERIYEWIFPLALVAFVSFASVFHSRDLDSMHFFRFYYGRRTAAREEKTKHIRRKQIQA